MTYIPGGSGGSGSIGTSSDVALNNPLDNDALVFDEATNKWVNAAIAVGDNAITTAKIAEGAIVDSKIAADASIAASKIAGLSTVAATGSYNDLTDTPAAPIIALTQAEYDALAVKDQNTLYVITG